MEKGGETWKERRKKDMSQEQTVPSASGYTQVIYKWKSVYPAISRMRNARKGNDKNQNKPKHSTSALF